MSNERQRAKRRERWTSRDFIIKDELYRSTTGIIYKARIRGRRGHVVLKERFISELGRDHNIQHELEMYAKAKHPHILKCLGYFWKVEGRKTLSLILEYAKYGDMRQHIEGRKRHFDEEKIWSILKQLADALAFLHANNIVHRDIKSSNVFVFDEDLSRVKLADLGVSRWMSSDTIMLRSFYGTPLYAVCIFFSFLFDFYTTFLVS